VDKDRKGCKGRVAPFGYNEKKRDYAEGTVRGGKQIGRFVSKRKLATKKKGGTRGPSRSLEERMNGSHEKGRGVENICSKPRAIIIALA